MKTLDPARVGEILASGGLLIDTRAVDEYLASHIDASISIMFEAGPGFGGRARDLLPLEAALVLLTNPQAPLDEAAAMLRGKGLDVAGFADGTGLQARSTPTAEGVSDGLVMIDVKDPGTRSLVKSGSGLVIPVENLWIDAAELDKSARIGVLAGWGVRAATAIGILERLKFANLTFVRTRPAGSRPPIAGPEEQIFRVGGSGGVAAPLRTERRAPEAANPPKSTGGSGG